MKTTIPLLLWCLAFAGAPTEEPLPTWVELHFDEVAGAPRKTYLRFAHYGFGEGEKWDESYRWFSRVWRVVLDQLKAYCDKERRA